MANSVKVLVVDDAAFMRTVLKQILISNGFSQVYEAKDGAEAVEQYKKVKPDIVTMDIVMPGMDGIQATKAILQIDPRARIVMVTSVEQKHVVEEAIQLGAKGYVVKPFDASTVVEALNKVLKSS